MLMLLFIIYLRGLFLYFIVFGGSVVGVRVLFMVIVILFGFCILYLVNFILNGRCFLKCCIIFCLFIYCNEFRYCNLFYINI